MRYLACRVAVALAVVAVSGACFLGNSVASDLSGRLATNVHLVVATKSTGDKALDITASIPQALATEKGHLYSQQLEGIDTSAGQKSFAHPGYVNPDNCVGGTTCQWTIAPSAAGNYEYKVVLFDQVRNETAGQSNVVKVHWSAPPKPKSIKLLINGQQRPHVALDTDHYYNFPAGKMRAVAKWTTNARHSGYYVQITDDFGASVKCRSGTTCRATASMPLAVGAEDSWYVEVLTTRGDKVVAGYKACLLGVS